MTEFSDILGQEAAISQLQQALGGSRMPHAFLFAGPSGVGRRTTAVALARTLLCEKPVTRPGRDGTPLRQACGRCANCRMIDAGSHPDFQLVYKELARFHEDARVRGRVMQELGIDVIAGFLLNPAYRAASRERGKVFVVLEAELMSAEAQNSLLKTLEEPPPGVTIVLLAERPEQMLPTTVSRCAVVRFRLLPREFVVSRLLEAEVPPPEAEFWAAFTEGSLGRALKLAKEDFYELKRDLLGRLAALREAGDAELGAYLTTKMEKLADAAVKALKAEQGAELSTMLANRRAAGTMLELIASGFRDAMKLNAAAAEGQAPPPLINADQAPAVRSLAERFDGGQLAGIIEQLSEYEELLWRNANPKIIWDNVVITCATAAALRF